MGNCSSSKELGSTQSGREDANGVFVVSTERNKATVVSQKTHAFSPSTTRHGMQPGVVEGRSAIDADKRRLSMQVPGDFFLGLDVLFDEVELNEKVGKGQFGEVFKAHVRGKR